MKSYMQKPQNLSGVIVRGRLGLATLAPLPPANIMPKYIFFQCKYHAKKYTANIMPIVKKFIVQIPCQNKDKKYFFENNWHNICTRNIFEKIKFLYRIGTIVAVFELSY